MNGVEAAASLFGPEEPTSDPFAALGEPQTSHVDPFPVIGASYTVHSSAMSQYSNPINVENAPTLPPSQEYHHQAVHSQNSSHCVSGYTSDLGAETTSHQGWYGEPAYHIPEPVLPVQQVSQHHDATSSKQDPYAQPSNFTSASNVSQSIYSDYTFAQPGQSYNPSATYSNSTYSYASSPQPSGPQYKPSYSASSQTPHIQQNVDPKPSVPLQAVEPINRPKVSNAYDPPFPTMTKSRRGAVPRTGLNQAYPGYDSFQTSFHPAVPEGPFAPLPSSQAPPLPTSAEQAGIQRPTEWEYSNHNTSVPHGVPPADARLFLGQTNSFNEAVNVDHLVAVPSGSAGNRAPDHTIPVPVAGIEGHDLYHPAPPASPTELPSHTSPLPARHHSLSGTRSSSPQNRLSPPSPLSDRPLVYGLSTSHIQAKDMAEGLTDASSSVTESSSGKFTSGSFPQKSDQTMLSFETRPFDSGSAADFQDRQMDPAAEAATPSSPTSVHGHTYDPYAPKSYVSGSHGERPSSPSSVRSWAPSGKPYPSVSQHSPPRADILRNRSMSNGPIVPSLSTSARDPYAPSQHPRRQKSETDYGIYGSHHGRPNYPSTLTIDHPPVQDVLVSSFHTPYAPSPSLLGANDPLGRTAARIPVFSFGFGGKFVTCFHGVSSLSTGFDVALSSRNSTGVHIRVLKQLIPQSALDMSTVIFPGPLFSDPGSLTSLVRTGSTSQTKTKKTHVVKYLAERTDEISLGLRYLNPDSTERLRAEGKLVLIKLLKVMVEHDGRLTGTPQLDMAVRVALLPRLEGSTDTNGMPATTFSTPVDSSGSIADSPPVPYPVPNGATSQEIPVSVITLKQSSLDTIQGFLLRGERREAYQHALDEKLWAHAMIIASSIDKEAWNEVVNDFLRHELRPKDLASGTEKPSNGRECLRVAYSLFSGQGAAAVQELVPQTVLSRASLSAGSQMTPRTPNFAVPSGIAPIPIATVSRWAETIAMMLSSSLSQETSAALTGLGDQLVANQLFEAAHACYLLAPQTSPIGGLGNASARIVLVGSQSPQTLPSFAKDPDPLIFSEIVEFALSLTAPARGQDPYQGIPHLQPYRFVRAMALSEIGDIHLASRYCEAITAAVGRSSPYFTTTLLDQLKELSDRITGVAHVDKSGSWMGARLSKPSLDTIGGWLEGRFTKLVTGDTDTPISGDEEAKAEDKNFPGPFAHYSTISSAAPSARSSPQPSLVNALPPARSGPAMASSTYHPQIDRASSAMDYVKPKSSPAPRVSSANPATTSFTYPPPGQSFTNLNTPNGYNTSDDMITARPAEHGGENTQQAGNWWGSSAYDETSATQTPTASTFLRVDENALPPSNGFISLMDNDRYSPALSPVNARPAAPAFDDDEDLGIGNSKGDKSKNEREGDGPSHTSQAPEATKPESKPPTSGSWISRWWKRSDSAMPGPIKASLGEESAFYYDKDLKRWVNKKAGDSEPPKLAAPPPPARAHTTSPGMSGVRHLETPSDTRPPPARPASAIDLSTSPPSKTVMRVKSNLAPLPESAPSTPTGSRSALPGPPPPGRPKSQASKRNIRSRYVDVFQQEPGA